MAIAKLFALNASAIMTIESYIKILICFSYLLNFKFVAIDKINHTGAMFINLG